MERLSVEVSPPQPPTKASVTIAAISVAISAFPTRAAGVPVGGREPAGALRWLVAFATHGRSDPKGELRPRPRRSRLSSSMRCRAGGRQRHRIDNVGSYGSTFHTFDVPARSTGNARQPALRPPRRPEVAGGAAPTSRRPRRVGAREVARLLARVPLAVREVGPGHDRAAARPQQQPRGVRARGRDDVRRRPLREGHAHRARPGRHVRPVRRRARTASSCSR